MIEELDYLQIRVVNHCNLNCRYCGSCCNSKEDQAYVDICKFTSYVKRIKELFPSIKTIKVLGGEPLLHPDLIEIIRLLRGSYPQSYMEIATNGILLLNMSMDNIKCVSELNVTFHITEYETVTPIIGDIKKKLDENNVKYYVSNTKKFFINKRKTLDSDIYKAWNICQCRDCLDFSDGYIYRCSAAWGMKKLNKQFETKYELNRGEDYVSIFDQTKHEIDDFIEKAKKPGHLCGYCCDKELKWVNWEPAGDIALSNYVLDE